MPVKKKQLLFALLLAMGCWGYIHLFSTIISAITSRSASLLNPLKMVRIDGLFGGLANRPWAIVVSWLVFFGSVYGIYRLLGRDQLGSKD